MNGAGLCIGLSTYSDGRLTSCPSAARTAQALATALGPLFSNGVTAVIDPKQTLELFMAIQTTARKARGGVLFLYFAGLTIRRDDDLLLTTSSSVLDAKSHCVPWSDIDSILAEEKVLRGLVVMNAEGFAGVSWGGAAARAVHAMGSIRIHDPLVAEQRIAAYGDALLDAFRLSAHEIRAHLSDGLLDVPALDRFLSSRFPRPERNAGDRPKRGEPPAHETFGASEIPTDVVLRDARDELTRPSTVALAVPSSARRLWPIALVALIAVVAVASILWVLLR